MFDLCLGCVFFRLFVQFGIIPSTSTDKANSLYEGISFNFVRLRPFVLTCCTAPSPCTAETVFAADEADERLDPAKQRPEPARKIGNLGNKGERTVPFKYKRSTVESQRQQFNLVKHMSISYFSMPMGIVGLACAWQYAHDPYFPKVGLIGPGLLVCECVLMPRSRVPDSILLSSLSPRSPCPTTRTPAPLAASRLPTPCAFFMLALREMLMFSLC